MELLKIFKEDKTLIGCAKREEVHQKGLWHETFACWFIGVEEGTWNIYLQLRSKQKENYPGLLDITSAGHLLENEVVEDGIREVKEELGTEVSFTDLYSIGIIPSTITTGNLIDREFIHTFLYFYNGSLEDFHLQEEEVVGIVKGRLYEFEALWLDEQLDMEIEGITYEKGTRTLFKKSVTKAAFVPHERTYYTRVITGINEYISKCSSI